MKKLLITDLDDTLYDWLGFFIPAFYSMLEELSIISGIPKNILTEEYKEIHRIYGSVEYPFATLKLPSIINKYGDYDESEIKKILGEAFHKFNSVRKSKLRLFDGVEKTFKELYNKNIIIVGYTESSQENGFFRLDRLGVSQYFKHVYATKSTYESPYPLDKKVKLVEIKKPNKEILFEICQNEGITIEEAVYVGDSLTKDIYMAKMANMTAVWANYKKEKNDYYDKLVAITSWTENDFANEKRLKQEFMELNLKPDYTITAYDQLLKLF